MIRNKVGLTRLKLERDIMHDIDMRSLPHNGKLSVSNVHDVSLSIQKDQTLFVPYILY